MNTKCPPPAIGYPSNYNIRNMDYLRYPNNVSDPVLSKAEPVVYEFDRHFVHVTSNVRNLDSYATSAHFKVDLPDVYRDVVSVRLLNGIFPNLDGIASDAFILMDIAELNHISSTLGKKYFSIMSLVPHTGPSPFVNLNKQSCDDQGVRFKPVKGKLSSLTIQLRHSDGTPVSFPTETSVDLRNQISLTFEITTRVRQRNNIDKDDKIMIHDII